MATAVAALEAAALAVGGAVSLVGAVGNAGWPLALAVGAVGLAVAYLLGRVALAHWRAERWQNGVFATVQVLVLLVALSIGSPALTAPAAAPRLFTVTALALVLAVAGLVGTVLAVRERRAAEGLD